MRKTVAYILRQPQSATACGARRRTAVRHRQLVRVGTHLAHRCAQVATSAETPCACPLGSMHNFIISSAACHAFVDVVGRRITVAAAQLRSTVTSGRTSARRARTSTHASTAHMCRRWRALITQKHGNKHQIQSNDSTVYRTCFTA
jgi:hypothetical protein